ncbi:MAG: hypothetical protein RLZZ401_2361 [Pseudomonadota bacterium]|jgi:outer membrane protein assembly factor BamE
MSTPPAASLCKALLGWTLLCALSACSYLSSSADRVGSLVTPYRMEVVQGNFVSKEQVDALQPGMTRAQVRDVLGSPLLASAFHADRWDYAFSLSRQGVESQARRLTVYFNQDLLARFDGDTMPSEAEFVTQLESGRKLGKVPALQASEDRLKAFAATNAGTTASPSRPVLPPAVAENYPPLEAAPR